MDKHNLNQVARDLFAAWDNGVEHALDNVARTEELGEQHLNEVAGMHVESGLRGGLWHFTEGSCTCELSCSCKC